MAESSVPGAVGERPGGAGDCGGTHHYGLCRSCGAYITSGGAVGEREEPPLDVERLARALNDTDHPECLGWDNPKAGCRGFYRRMAKAASHEYARLSVHEGGPEANDSEAAYRKGYKHGYEAAKKEDPRSMLRSVNEGGVAPPTYEVVERLDRPGNRADRVAPVEPQEPA